MSSQPRAHSLVESLVNIGIGYWISLMAQLFVFPIYGIHIALDTNIKIGIIFTVISLIRQYALRRLFNWIDETHGPG